MQISEEIIKTLDYIGEKFGLVVDWTSDNIIPYFTELCGKIINYEIYTSIIWIIIFIIATAVTVLLSKKIIKTADNEDIIVVTIVIAAFLILPFIIGICTQIFDIVECKVFPEKYLMEYFTNLLSKR